MNLNNVLSNASSVFNTIRARLRHDDEYELVARHGNQVYRSTTVPWYGDESDGDNDSEAESNKENQEPKTSSPVKRSPLQSKSPNARAPLGSPNAAAATSNTPTTSSRRSDNEVREEKLILTEDEEKAQLIAQIIEKTKTLELLHNKVMSNKEENRRLEGENRAMDRHVTRVMRKSSTFQPIEKPPSSSVPRGRS